MTFKLVKRTALDPDAPGSALAAGLMMQVEKERARGDRYSAALQAISDNPTPYADELRDEAFGALAKEEEREDGRSAA